MTFLERVVRYPVKGLRGEVVDAVLLETGHGLEYDRALAIETGNAPPSVGWARRETFFHLARDAELIGFRASVEESSRTVRIDPPDGSAINVRLSDAHRDADLDAAGRALAAVLPRGRSAPRLTMRSEPVWDWPDATISVVNLDTIDELSRRAGRHVDPRRFRANLYVSGLGAWTELDLLGRRLQVGSATLEVMWPIERCRATTIDPETGETDLNLPALLASELGHMFCGVYARVVGDGTVENGAEISLDATPRSASYRMDDDTRRWPRRAHVIKTVRESDDIVSIWLSDPLGLATMTTPGQHLRLHPAGEPNKALWRCYTISAVDGDAYRISVKRDGEVSSLLQDAYTNGAGLVISGPFGNVTLNPNDRRPLLLFSAGIGLTPTIAMLRAVRDDPRPVHVVHVERGDPPAGLWQEVQSIIASLPHASIEIYSTTTASRPSATGRVIAGRPRPVDIARAACQLGDKPLVFICGPAEFYDDVLATLLIEGIDATTIRREVFFTPSAAQCSEPSPPPDPGPFAVRFVDADTDMCGTWEIERGTLLNVGESLGLPIPSGCRVGACGSCALRVSDGSTAYVSGLTVPAPEGTVLLCSAVPTSDVTVQLP